MWPPARCCRRWLQQNGFYGYASSQPLDLINGVALLFALASVWPVYRRMGIPYAVLVLMTVLPPLAMGGLLSMGRITSVIFPLFVWLGTAVPQKHRIAWLMGFAMLQALGAVVFLRGGRCIERSTETPIQPADVTGGPQTAQMTLPSLVVRPQSVVCSPAGRPANEHLRQMIFGCSSRGTQLFS